jgi:hypothetical protein
MVFRCAFVFVLRAGMVGALARANIRLCDNRRQHSLFLSLFTINYFHTVQFIFCNFFSLLTGENGGW